MAVIKSNPKEKIDIFLSVYGVTFTYIFGGKFVDSHPTNIIVACLTGDETGHIHDSVSITQTG
jgi:hypothetical protein